MGQHFVYVVQAVSPDGDIEAVKIGRTADPIRRLGTLQTGNHRKLEFSRLYQIGDSDADWMPDATAKAIEARLRRRCQKHVIHGEWFGNTETVEGVVKQEMENLPDYLQQESITDLSRRMAIHYLMKDLMGFDPFE